MKTTINERFKLLRTHLNLTQNDFAHLIDLTPTQLSRIENNSAKPNISTLKELQKKIEVANDWLLEGKGDLKATLKEAVAQDSNPWKDALVLQVKEENNRLQTELNRVWAMVQFLSKGEIPDFLKATKGADLSQKHLPGKGFDRSSVAYA